MPTRSVSIKHDLSQDGARNSLKAFFDSDGSRFGISGSWVGIAYQFEADSQVGNISGQLQVEPGLIQCSVTVPIVALPFTGWLPGMIQHCLKRGSLILREQALQIKGPEDTVKCTVDTTADPLILYLHIPKTGGISLSDYIYSHCRLPAQRTAGHEDPFIRNGVYFSEFGFIKPPGLEVPSYTREVLARKDLTAFVGHFWYGIHRLTNRDCQYVTVLRNPVDRMISLYYYLEANMHMSLEDFVLQPSIKELDNDQTRRIAGVDPAIGECNEDILDLAIENLGRFAVTGVTERMDMIASKMKTAFGWEDSSISMGFKNVGHNRSKARSITESERLAILRASACDLKLYRYTLEHMKA